MKPKNLTFCLSGFLCLSACDRQPAEVAKAESVQEPPRFDPASIRAARSAIVAEPSVKDLLFDEEKYGIEWQVAVASDGNPRHGYAAYICQLLAENRVVDPDVEVRIVDAATIDRGRDFRSASLGTVRCSDGTRLDEAPALSQ